MVNSQRIINQADNRQSIGRLLETQADVSSDASVIIAPDREPLSFRQLFLQAHDTVKSLNAHGIGRGDRVAAVLRSGPEAATTFLTII